MILKNWTWLVCFMLAPAVGSDMFSASNPAYERALTDFIREIDASYPFFELKNIRKD